MKITQWYKLVKPARSSGGDKYEAIKEEGKLPLGPPTDVLYINQHYSRSPGPLAERILVTFDFGEEADGS